MQIRKFQSTMLNFKKSIKSTVDLEIASFLVQSCEDGPKYLLPINCKIRGGFAPLHFCVASEHIGQWKTRAVSTQLIPHLCDTNKMGRSRDIPQCDSAIIAELFFVGFVSRRTHIFGDNFINLQYPTATISIKNLSTAETALPKPGIEPGTFRSSV